jgi:ectoine hydroxylase-related dioxygenase (phytanoyl-CoA dioxygenase family)
VVQAAEWSPSVGGTQRTHGVREFRRSDTAVALHAEEVATVGFTVLSRLLDEEEIAQARSRIDDIYARQVDELGGAQRLEEINDADVARCLLAYDDFFVDLAAHPEVLAVVRELLGRNVVLMSQNGIINRSQGEHYQLSWHRDLNYQHFVSSRPLAVSALWCIEAFSAETGGTVVLPASHKVEEFPSDSFVRRNERSVDAPAGSVLLFDSMLFHRTGHNRSGRVRRAVNHIYTAPLIRQQISLPRALNGRFAEDPELRELLGYPFEAGESVQEWRQRKLEVPVEARTAS